MTVLPSSRSTYNRAIAISDPDTRPELRGRWGEPVPENLPFHRLTERHPGVTRGVGEYYTEAARVCLDRHHSSPIQVRIDSQRGLIVSIAEWTPTDEQTRRAWANEIDATEAGAYALALAAVELAQGQVAVRRAETRTGADYYVAPIGAAKVQDLEDWYRLEVSGVDRGDENAIRGRLREKLQQALNGASNLPALAAVIGFRARFAVIAPADNT